MKKISLLTVEENDDQFCQELKPQGIRKLGSAKNLHELRQKNDKGSGSLTLAIQIKLMNVKNLEKEKNFLMDSFETLKGGAIDALVQKQGTIQSLKQKCQKYESNGGYEAKSELQLELQNHYNHICECQRDRDNIKIKLQNDRRMYTEDIEEKSQIISVLCNQLRTVNQKLDQLERDTLMLQIKHRMAYQKNQNMKRCLKEALSSIHQLKQKSNNKDQIQQKSSNKDQIQISRKISQIICDVSKSSKHLQSPTSSASTNPNFMSNLFLRQKAKIQLDEQKLLKEKFQEQQQQHIQRLRKIKKYYSDQLETLKFNIQNKKLEFDCLKLNQRMKSEPIYYQVEESAEEESKIEYQEDNNREFYKPSKQLSDCSGLKEEIQQDQVNIVYNNQNTNKKVLSLNQQSEIISLDKKMVIQEPILKPQNKTYQRHQHQWKQGLFFGLGFMVGGSLMALINKVLVNNK